jgi:hypothetical protein
VADIPAITEIYNEAHHNGQKGRGEPSQFGSGPAAEKAETAQLKDDFVGRRRLVREVKEPKLGRWVSQVTDLAQSCSFQ